MTSARARLLDQHFYFGMSLLVATAVTYGFSHTIGARLLHPAIQPPLILSFHGALFFSWLLLFIVQSALVRTRNVRIHRSLGWAGAALGALMVPVGVSTALAMGRFDILQLHKPGVQAFMIVPLHDMTVFAVLLTLAILWRRKPEFHRRAIFMATCCITSAGFGRFPIQGAHVYFYLGVDSLILCGVMRDLLVNRRIHPVYLYGLPMLMVSQIAVVYTYTHSLAVWIGIANRMLGL